MIAWIVRESPEYLQFIMRVAWMCVANLMAIDLSSLSNRCGDILQKKVTCWRSNRESQMITKVIVSHHLGTMNVCTKSCASPSNSCWDISVWTKALDQQTSIAINRAILPGPLKMQEEILYLLVLLIYYDRITFSISAKSNIINLQYSSVVFRYLHDFRSLSFIHPPPP